MNENKNKAQDATLRHSEEDVNDTTPFCEYLIIDSKGYYCCVYRLDAPAYCTPENCPYLEGAVQ